MKKFLQNLGVKIIFNADTADLGGIFQVEIPDLKVSEIIQKAVIQINEEGAEAAAAAGVHIRRTRAIEIVEELFNANDPFIYTILHIENAELSEKDTSILFYGSSAALKSIAKFAINTGLDLNNYGKGVKWLQLPYVSLQCRISGCSIK
ncbi:unnamed protein product [Allacma fusca]|uniref:Serpin domain-containing protein n=1 Tax=Allacma fusca TaxID=39272 RepID=A0A8J2NNJ0_9HEXA|nr:unnamed protein product [Allacma fusca]